MKTFRSFYEQLTPQDLRIRYIERQQALKQERLVKDRQREEQQEALKQERLVKDRQQREQQEAKQREREEKQAAQEQERNKEKISDLEQKIRQLTNQ